MQCAAMKNEMKIGPHDRVLKHDSQFQPYNDNGGNVVAIAGKDFAIIASDTRLTTGYSIYTRNQSKLFKINDKVMLGAAGCWCDVVTFNRILEIRSKMYRYDHNQELSNKSAAQLVSTMLYNRRFFPYYIDTTLVGLDENGRGWVYHYDPVGNYEPLRYTCSGSGSALIMPFLDNQVGKKNMENVEPGDLELDEALKVVKDALTSASEREITCGDDAHICIITKDGIREEKMEMRRD